MSDADIDRIIKMHISPVNISVHTTNPALRCQMMKNKRAGLVLDYIKRLCDAGITVCGQIVLCKGLNDGAELTRTMHDLATLHPSVQSVSIVPAGMTKYREGLYPLEPFSKEDSRKVLAQVETFAEQCLAYYGSRIFFCDDCYEGYPQIENGVGMITSLWTEFETELAYLDEYTEGFVPKTKSIATGEAAYALIRRMCDTLCARVPGLTVHVYKIRNDFFGETITVAGLLTGHDLYAQLQDKPLGQELLIPAATLKADEDLFLCGMTLNELSEKLRNGGIRLLHAAAVFLVQREAAAHVVADVAVGDQVQRHQQVEVAFSGREGQDPVHSGEDVLILRAAGIGLVQAPVVRAGRGLLREQPAVAVRIGVGGGRDRLIVLRDQAGHLGEGLGAGELMSAVGNIVALVERSLDRQRQNVSFVEYHTAYADFCQRKRKN